MKLKEIICRFGDLRPSPPRSDPSSRQRFRSRKSNDSPMTDGQSFSDHLLANNNLHPQTLTYVNHHHPVIKSRLLRTHLVSHSEPKIVNTLRPLPPSPRKGTARTQGRRRSPNREAQEGAVPEFVRSMLKPCRIAAINLEERPKTTSRKEQQAESKIYLRRMMMEKKRVSTLELCALRRHPFDPWESQHPEIELWLN